MTQNQSTILVNNPTTKKAMAILGKFAEKELAYKKAEKEAKAATELIKEAMIAGGVDKVTIDIPGFTGYITLAERTNYRAEGDFLEDSWQAIIDLLMSNNILGFDGVGFAERLQYLKPALDTDKVKAQHTLTGQLPVGVVESKTQYITKKFKAVE